MKKIFVKINRLFISNSQHEKISREHFQLTTERQVEVQEVQFGDRFQQIINEEQEKITNEKKRKSQSKSYRYLRIGSVWKI